jgi:hypothetical protein
MGKFFSSFIGAQFNSIFNAKQMKIFGPFISARAIISPI